MKLTMRERLTVWVFLASVVMVIVTIGNLINIVAYGLDNVTVSVEKGTTTSCDEVGDDGDTYVECRRVDALVDKERQELNKALDNAYKSPDKGDDLIADQLCEFRPYKYCERK